MLKAGTQTGSLVNHLHSRAVRGAPEPEVGMPATILHWTDRSPATIVSVETVGNALIIGAQDDLYQRTDKNGFSETQTYDYSPNPNGHIQYFRRDKNGFWKQVRKNAETGRWNKSEGSGIRLGVREKYWDPCF